MWQQTIEVDKYIYEPKNHKLCPKCNKVKSLDDFHKRSKSKDGLQPYCKECQNLYTMNRAKATTKRARLNLLRRLSYYKQRHGLEYEFIGKQKHNKFRNSIRFKCIKCGCWEQMTIPEALTNHFICSHCLDKRSNEIQTVIPQTKQENKKLNSNKPHLIEELKQLENLYPNCLISIMIEPINEQNEELIEEHNCSCYQEKKIKKPTLWQRIKNLFKK